MSSTASPVAPPPGRTSFKTILRKTQNVVGNLTVAFLLIKEGYSFVSDVHGQDLGEGELGGALIGFAVGFTIEATFAVLINYVLIAPPIAALIYYTHDIARDR